MEMDDRSIPSTQKMNVNCRRKQSGYGGFMCSIGKGKTASNIIKELSKSVTGKAKDAFDEIANYLSN